MNKNIKNILLISIIFTIIMFVSSFIAVKAAEEQKASLTIVQYEQANGNLENVPLKGAEFTIYSVPEGTNKIEEAEDYINKQSTTKYTKETPESGTIVFSNLELGTYFVKETKIPKNVVKKVESFLIDLPRTSETGKDFIYDVTVYPKSKTIYGSLTFEYDLEGKENKDGIVWRLEKIDENGNAHKYVEDGTLVTDRNGKFSIQNLEKGKYNLTQLTPVEDYVLNQTNPIKFEIDEMNRDIGFVVKNKKININHYIKLSNGEYGKTVGLNTTEKASWKTEATVISDVLSMEKYCITETIPEGLSLEENSINAYVATNSGTETKLSKSAYNVDIQGQKFTITFKKEKIANYQKVIVKYDTLFNYSTIKEGEYVSKAELEYTNFIDVNGESISNYRIEDTASTYTASVLVFKVDENNEPLQGAKFKIAETKEKANNKEFLKDLQDNEIIATSNENGYIIFNGLKIGEDNQKYNDAETKYWIVEVQAPSYVEENETKYYALKREPVCIKVNKNSGDFSETGTTIIVNKKEFKLPLTGGRTGFILPICGFLIIIVAIYIKEKNKKREKEIEDK